MREEYHISYNDFKEFSISSFGANYWLSFRKKDMVVGLIEEAAVFEFTKKDIQELLKILQKINTP